jgi:tRNA modification GTPase
LIVQGAKGRLLREGVRVAIVGRPNVGKSSLFNALVGLERALVTPHPGTTRDTIEATVDLKGLAVTYIDTAGVRQSRDEVESLGIERTQQELSQADCVLFVLDAS